LVPDFNAAFARLSLLCAAGSSSFGAIAVSFGPNSAPDLYSCAAGSLTSQSLARELAPAFAPFLYPWLSFCSAADSDGHSLLRVRCKTPPGIQIRMRVSLTVVNSTGGQLQPPPLLHAFCWLTFACYPLLAARVRLAQGSDSDLFSYPSLRITAGTLRRVSPPTLPSNFLTATTVLLCRV
jgi:hypothetical protein